LAWDVDASALSASVPTLLLQPLLENAFKHGVEKSQGLVMIQVRARRENDAVVFMVCNTGELSAPSEPGVGLRNSRERLRLMYGAAAALTLTQHGSDVVAQLTFPWQEHV
jgi:LytS/YehU family sensor histidine kinase